ncbi:MAG: hypothetical protein ACOYL3_06965 [Desulfuromonadaceae bacterium]
MPETPNPNWIPRQQILTHKDLEELAALMQSQLAKHPCQFGNLTHDQMDRIAKLAEFFERAEKKIMDSITYAVLALIGGLIWILYNHGYGIHK